jgi:hypothetical protein
MGATFDTSRPPSVTGSFGDMYSQLLQLSTALLVIGNLVAMVRPANWASWATGKPATWDILGDCELMVGMVQAVSEQHVKVELIRFMASGGASVINPVDWSVSQAVRMRKPTGKYLILREYARLACDTACKVKSVSEGPSRVVDLCSSQPTVIDNFVPQLVPNGRQTALSLEKESYYHITQLKPFK